MSSEADDASFARASPEAGPSVPSGTGEPVKKKRKQLSSCDACRLRRVKCIRENDDEVCESCSAKGINCTSDYIRGAKLPKAQRGGKLIIQARATYGTVDDVSPPPVAPAPLPRLVAPPPPLAPAVDPLSGGLVPVLTPELGRHLLERFFALIHFQLPVLTWESFHARFEAADGDPARMGDTGEALCYAVLAFGARVSDSPLILGPYAPSIGSLRERTRRGEDLSRWGRAREAFCQSMLARAIAKADEHAIMRKPSIDSISALMMLTYLVDHGDPSHKRGRLYSAAAYEQLRELVTDGRFDDNSEEMVLLRGGRLFWTSFVKDSLVSAHTGRPPQLTTTDIECFCPQIFETTHEGVLEALGGSDPAQVARAAAMGLFGQIGLLARRVNERLTGPIARRRPQLDLAFIETEFWSDIDRSATLCTFFNSRLETLFPVRSGTFTLWLRTLIICRLALVAHVDALLRDHRAAGSMARDDSPGTAPAYLAEVDRLLQHSRERVFRCMRETMSIVKTAALTGVAIGGGLLLNGLPRYAALILDTPSEEEGGVPGWTIQNKIEDLHWLVAALRSLGWSWDDSQQSISLVTSALDPLREKARQLTGSTFDIALSPPIATATPAILPSLQATTPATSTESVAAPLTPPSGPAEDGANALEPWMMLNLGGPMPLVNPFDQPTSSEWPPSMQVDEASAPASTWPFDLDSLLDPAASAD